MKLLTQMIDRESGPMPEELSRLYREHNREDVTFLRLQLQGWLARFERDKLREAPPLVGASDRFPRFLHIIRSHEDLSCIFDTSDGTIQFSANVSDADIESIVDLRFRIKAAWLRVQGYIL